jgi:hypothetical protein
VKAMTDLISRQAAIDALGDSHFKNYGNAILVIKDLPSAEPVKNGKWVFNPSDAFEAMFAKPKCSECGFESADGGNYCPNCGARMDKND